MTQSSDQNSPEVTGVSSGTVITNTWEIEKVLSSGGMGEVYRGRNIHDGSPVAIKVVLASLAHEPKIQKLFLEEARNLQNIYHEAVVRYFTYTKDPGIGRNCLVMEFVDGLPLSERIKQGPLSEEEVLRLFRRVASGLQKAHERVAAHRDLSPDNILLQDGMVDRAKIIDFGIAKSLDTGAGTLLGGEFAGKFKYVSPEQLGYHGGKVDKRTDIYSLALVMAAALRGRELDMGGSMVDAVDKRRSVPDLGDVPLRFRALLARMLEPDPARRFADMGEVLQALERLPEPGGAPEAAGDDERTMIGGKLELIPEAGSVPVESLPPVSDAALPEAVVRDARHRDEEPRDPEPPPPEPRGETLRGEELRGDEGSPFGPVAALEVRKPPPTPPAAPAAKKRGGGLLIALLLLLLAGGGAAGWFLTRPPPAPAVPQITEADRQAWLSANLPECSLLQGGGLLLGGDPTPEARLAALREGHQAALGRPLETPLEALREAQCPALDFARELKTAAPLSFTPTETSGLSRDPVKGNVIRSGAVLGGDIAGLAGRPLALLLIDDQGGVNGMSAFVTPEGADRARFSLPLTLNDGEGRPLLLMGLATTPDLAGLGAISGRPAVGPLLERLQGMLAESGEAPSLFVQQLWLEP